MRRRYTLIGLFALTTLIAVAYALAQAAVSNSVATPDAQVAQAGATIVGSLVGIVVGFLAGGYYGYFFRDRILGALVGAGFGGLGGMLLISGVDAVVLPTGSLVLIVYAVGARLAANQFSQKPATAGAPSDWPK